MREDTDTTKQSRSEEIRIARQGLRSRIDRLTKVCGPVETAISELSFFRLEEPNEPTSYIHDPSICFIAQGSKRLFLGKDVYVYDADRYLITALDVPVIAQVLEATKERPYLSMKLKIDQRTITQFMVDNDFPTSRHIRPNRAMIVSEFTLPILTAFLRLIDILDEPESIPILSPLIQREIMYRLLVSEQGPYLRQIGAAGSQGYQISRAIDWLKRNFTKRLRIEDLASNCRMSASSFHHHFRTMTAMSPLQYQKLLRLQEARRLMLAERLDAADAAFRVGYESPSQFSREYSRLYHVSPSRDVKALLNTGESSQHSA